MFDVSLQPDHRATAFVAEMRIVQFDLLVQHGFDDGAAVAGGLKLVNQTFGIHSPDDVLQCVRKVHKSKDTLCSPVIMTGW